MKEHKWYKDDDPDGHHTHLCRNCVAYKYMQNRLTYDVFDREKILFDYEGLDYEAPSDCDSMRHVLFVMGLQHWL